ncbi:hypothetical protein ACLK1T_17055 [Escherichia coli]
MRCRKMTLSPVLAHLSEDDLKQVLTLIADFRKELDSAPSAARTSGARPSDAASAK